MIRVGRWLIRKVDEYHTQNFSSDSDFPFAFAKKILYLPVMWLLVMWTQFLVDSQLLKASSTCSLQHGKYDFSAEFCIPTN